ncbi:hypothetical protein BC962_1334 [Gillisia mitskevichiae]|uniref:Uncharacterized protein n=1 Tax=Gillisia mitskevichiae TaxID=270921 RepID=A0A495PUD9_9FLAO|nr:hypothetical protein [Gillisia mitskevichiae]RKS53088.1 hypothetical protein BC962_1334 [Gillisia mitskevichiae]
MKNIKFILILFIGIIASCQKDDDSDGSPVILSDKNLITSFQINIAGELVSGEINETDKTINFNTEDADLASLVPIIEYSDKASISPAPTVSQNFENEVSYTLIAENGDSNIYRVLVKNISSNTNIFGFQLLIEGKVYDGEVDNTAKTLYAETDNVLDSADIVFSLPEGSTIASVQEDPQNFYLPVEYIVKAENGTTATFTLTAKAYNFFGSNAKLFYSDAIAIASGTGIDLSVPNSSLVLENEQNSYTIQNILTTNSSSYTNGMPFNSLSFRFPENIVTATNYKLKYLIDGEVKTTSIFNVDVLSEDVPVINSINQDSYSWNDILIINGKNLPETISIPSNGSLFIIQNSGNYDLTVNNEKTELRLTLDYHYLFPSYFGRPEAEKTITLYGPNRRIGTTINTVFK